MRVSIFAILTLLLAAGCQSAIPHPPTYDDFVSACNVKQSKNAEMISSEDVRLFQALEFTDQDLKTLRSSTDMTIMIGAGIARSGHPIADKMLLDATQKESKAGVAEIWLSRRELKDLDSPFQREEHERRLHESVEKLYRDASDNAFSHYLMASVQTPTFGDVATIDLIKSGNSKPFNGYSKETLLSIVAAAESVGYSPYAAYHYSLGSLVPVSIYSTLRKRCSELFQRDHSVEARTECLAMGQNIEISSPTILEKLLALAIQRDALKGTSDPKAEEKILLLEQRRAELLKWVGNDCPPLSQNIVKDYFKIFIEQGEEAALKFAKSKQQ